jgi:Domain of unknown function (DUF3943)
MLAVKRAPVWPAAALLLLLEVGACLAASLPAPAPGSPVDGQAETTTDVTVPGASLPLEPDWAGLSRDMAFLLGYQIITVGALYLLPESVSSWSSDNKEASASKWLENVQEPRWDKDGVFMNYIAHPYVGAVYYTRARERGFGKPGAFVFSAVASAAYEFGVEALFEHPSYQDLIVTPVAGALLGAFVFEPVRTYLKSKADRRWYEDVTLFATDPLGAINGALERLLGIKSQLRVAPRGDGAGQPTGVSIELRMSLP